MFGSNVMTKNQLVECGLIDKLIEILNDEILNLDIGKLACWNILNICKRKAEIPLSLVSSHLDEE
jgi:hypothetical protein